MRNKDIFKVYREDDSTADDITTAVTTTEATAKKFILMRLYIPSVRNCQLPLMAARFKAHMVLDYSNRPTVMVG
jgi:hypothetical protein